MAASLGLATTSLGLAAASLGLAPSSLAPPLAPPLLVINSIYRDGPDRAASGASVTDTGYADVKERRRSNAAVVLVFNFTASLGGRPETDQREAGGLSLFIGGLPDRFTS